MATKQISLRMPEALIREIEGHGDRTSFILEAVRDKLRQEAEAELIAGLMNLVDDPENDISDFQIGQERVIVRGD